MTGACLQTKSSLSVCRRTTPLNRIFSILGCLVVSFGISGACARAGWIVRKCNGVLRARVARARHASLLASASLHACHACFECARSTSSASYASVRTHVVMYCVHAQRCGTCKHLCLHRRGAARIRTRRTLDASFAAAFAHGNILRQSRTGCQPLSSMTNHRPVVVDVLASTPLNMQHAACSYLLVTLEALLIFVLR